MAIGPVQLIFCSLKKGMPPSKIVDKLDDLQEAGAFRLVDLYVFRRDKKGIIQSMAVKELATSDEVEYGSIIRRLIGEKEKAGRGGSRKLNNSSSGSAAVFGLSQDDIHELVKLVKPGKTAVIILVEQSRIAELGETISQAGGAVKAQGLLTREALQTVSFEIEERIGQIDAALSAGQGTFEEAMSSLISSAAARAQHEETALRAAEMLVEEQLADPEKIDEVVRIVAEAIRIEELLNE